MTKAKLNKSDGVGAGHISKDRELKRAAKEAVEFLDHLRVEHGCETTLGLLDDAACLVSAIHTALHGEGEEDVPGMANLTEELSKVLRAAPLDGASILRVFWAVTMTIAHGYNAAEQGNAAAATAIVNPLDAATPREHPEKPAEHAA
jgi:hypothetical protein